MKKATLLIIALFIAMRVFAQHGWTIQTVPNTRFESNEIHVSDPDGYLSDSTEIHINTALCAIREQADVFIVTLSSIGEAEPKRFANQLFNYWGIGDAATNNGVLLLFVEDQRALEFETGYGAEATLTDAQCERIFRNSIVPYFRAGDYEGGLCAGVGEIVSVYGGEIPLGLITTLPKGSNEGGGDDDISDLFFYFALFLISMPVIGFIFWMSKIKKENSAVLDTYNLTEEEGVSYIDGFKTNWSGSPWEGKGCLGGLMLGFSAFFIMIIAMTFMVIAFPGMEERRQYDWIAILTLILYFTWICFRQNHRALKSADKFSKLSVSPREMYKAALHNGGNIITMVMAPWLGVVYYLIFKKRMAKSHDSLCPKCQAHLSEDGNFSLPEIHAVENRVEALRFTPYRCANGHKIVIKERGRHFSSFKTCEKCGAHTLKLTNTETLSKADYSHSGEKRETYVCQHCGDILTKTVVIPKLVRYSSSSSSSSSYSRSSNHRSSGGSFGGGRSGGGGYSGRW